VDPSANSRRESITRNQLKASFAVASGKPHVDSLTQPIAQPLGGHWFRVVEQQLANRTPSAHVEAAAHVANFFNRENESIYSQVSVYYSFPEQNQI
jgi:hypothetical protein